MHGIIKAGSVHGSKGGKILDSGCGSGIFIQVLATVGAAVTGMVFSEAVCIVK